MTGGSVNGAGGANSGGTSAAGSGGLGGMPGQGAGAAGAPVSGGSAGMGQGGQAGMNPGSAGQAGSAGAPSSKCGQESARPVVEIDADLTSSRTWTCDKIYLLNRPINVVGTVESRTVLTIEPGTLIRGAKGVMGQVLPGALIVTRTGQLIADGTREEPIVFTSNVPVGQRSPGDWGGVILLGRGPNNVGETNVEGVPQGEVTKHGAPLGSADHAWNCGVMRFVRIEFSGFILTGSKEINGLTLGSCGYETTIDHIQVHRGSDDGVELFGGVPDLKHVVITGAQDDSLDWDQGYSGRIQYLVAQLHPGDADKAIEADNNEKAPLAVPISTPRLFNLTLIGVNLGGALPTSSVGITLRNGSHGSIRNSIIMGFDAGALDVAGNESEAALQTARLSVENSIFVGVPGKLFPTGSDDKADNDLIESDFFAKFAFSNRSFADAAEASAASLLPDPFHLSSPNWVPISNSPAASMAEAPSELPLEGYAGAGAGGAGGAGAITPQRPPFFDLEATFVGAFEPGGNNWAEGWTAFPPN